MKISLKDLLTTAIPIVFFAVTSILTWELASSRGEIPLNQLLGGILFVIAGILCVVALIRSIPLAIKKKWNRALGILAGLCIGVIALVVINLLVGYG